MINFNNENNDISYFCIHKYYILINKKFMISIFSAIKVNNKKYDTIYYQKRYINFVKHQDLKYLKMWSLFRKTKIVTNRKQRKISLKNKILNLLITICLYCLIFPVIFFYYLEEIGEKGSNLLDILADFLKEKRR